jgi:hypothetical protein
MSDMGSPFFGEDWPLEGDEELVLPEWIPGNPVPAVTINDKRSSRDPETANPEAPGKRRYENVYHTLHAKWTVPADIASTRENVWALSNVVEAELAAVLARHLGAVNGFELILQMNLR